MHFLYTQQYVFVNYEYGNKERVNPMNEIYRKVREHFISSFNNIAQTCGNLLLIQKDKELIFPYCFTSVGLSN